MIGTHTQETSKNHHPSSYHIERPREEKRWTMEHLAKRHGKGNKRDGINQSDGEDGHGQKNFLG